MIRIDRKRVSLPVPPTSATEESLLANRAFSTDANGRLEELLKQRDEMNLRVEELDAQIENLAIESICGFTDDTQHVEKYDGTLGATREFVNEYEPRIGQLQWLDDLAERFSGVGETAGNVSGHRWGSGGMISDDLFLSAGHCFDSSGGGWARPARNGITIAPSEIATLMQVNFNYQLNGETDEIRPGESFGVDELLEYRLGNLDFAIVRLAANSQGELPGEKYGVLAPAPTDPTTLDAMLVLIQHPAGSPKKVEAGPLKANSMGRITYDSLDTLGGSSGAPIQSLDGTVVGVHTNGGCSTFSGANRGVAIGAIRSVSSFLH